MTTSGLDLLVVGGVSSSALREALASSLGLPNTAISVIDRIENWPERGAFQIVALLEPAGGDVTHRVSLIASGTEPAFADSVRLVQRIAHSLRAACVVPDGSPDPLAATLVEPTGHVQPVTLDLEREHEGVYVILRPNHLGSPR